MKNYYKTTVTHEMELLLSVNVKFYQIYLLSNVRITVTDDVMKYF
jgi:hypothetical protein